MRWRQNRTSTLGPIHVLVTPAQLFGPAAAALQYGQKYRSSGLFFTFRKLQCECRNKTDTMRMNMSWTPLLRFTLGQADINDNRNFLQCENDNDADQMRHTYCINNMKQNTLTWVILHTANHPQCKHNRAVSLKWNPHSPAGLLVVCLAGGRLRLPRWFFSCSTALAPAGLMIQARHDRWEGFETLAQTAHVPTDTEPHPSHYDNNGLDALIPAYSTSEPRLKACSRRHTFTHLYTLCLIQRKLQLI